MEKAGMGRTAKTITIGSDKESGRSPSPCDHLRWRTETANNHFQEVAMAIHFSTLRRGAWVILVFGLLISSAGWAGTIQGIATYRERLALPPDAIFEAELQDISRADAPAVILGRARLVPAGQPPFRFEIEYDGAAVEPRGRYAVRATITYQGRLLFTTDRIHPVLDGRNAPLELLLVSAGRAATHSTTDRDILGPLPATFEGELPGASGSILWHLDLFPEERYQLRLIYLGKPAPNSFDDIGRWRHDREKNRLVLMGGREAPIYLMPVDGGSALRKLDFEGKPISSSHNDRLARLPKTAFIEPHLFLTGMFSYMADAARIILCADGRNLPVAMEGDYKALEIAYGKAVEKPGQSVLVTLEGLITKRPSMEEGRPPETTLVVKRLIAVTPQEGCRTILADSPLRDVYWKVVRLADRPVVTREGQREAHLILASHDQRVSGSTGCNRLSGTFQIEADTLRFGPISTTKMACPNGADEERQFLKAMANVSGYRIRGNHLELLDAEGTTIVQLEAVALR